MAIELLDEYNTVVLSNMAKTTQKEYMWEIKRFLKNYDEVTAYNVSIYLHTLPSDVSQHRTLTALKKFVLFLSDSELIDEKEFKKINRIKIRVDQGKSTGKVLTEKEIRDCNSSLLLPLHRFLFFLGLNFGLRRSEYIKLTIDMIDLKNRTIEIKGKGNKTRYIPIADENIPFFELWLKLRKTEGIEHNYLIYGKNKGVVGRTIERYFVELSNVTGIKFTSHDLRRTFATRLWRLGKCDVVTISNLLGHANLAVTSRYLKPSQEEINERYIKAFTRMKSK